MGIFKDLKNKYFSNNEDIHGCKVVNPISKVDMMRILKLFEDKDFDGECEYVGSGDYGHVYKFKGIDGSVYKIKVYESEGSPCDGKALEKLQGSEYYPKLFFYIPHQIVVSEFVEGEIFQKFIRDFDKNNKATNEYVDEIDKDLVKSMKFALKKKVVPRDLHEGNIVISKNTGKPVVIDVGCFDVSYGKWSESFKFEKNNSTQRQYADLQCRFKKLKSKVAEREEKGLKSATGDGVIRVFYC